MGSSRLDDLVNVIYIGLRQRIALAGRNLVIFIINGELYEVSN